MLHLIDFCLKTVSLCFAAKIVCHIGLFFKLDDPRKYGLQTD